MRGTALDQGALEVDIAAVSDAWEEEGWMTAKTQAERGEVSCITL